MITFMPRENIRDINKNIEIIKNDLREIDADYLFYPELFFQGESFIFDYKSDVELAFSRKSKEIAEIKETAEKFKKGVGFGYYENDHGGLYSSYLIINKEGEEIYNYRRRAKWPETENADYRTGEIFYCFILNGKIFSLMFIEDFFADYLFNDISQIECDYLLIPGIDYNENFVEHTALVSMPAVFYNSSRSIIAKHGKLVETSETMPFFIASLI